MSGTGIKAANVTVLAPEGQAAPWPDRGWRVFHGGHRRRARLVLRRREVLVISHANENRPGAAESLSANSCSAAEAFAERPAR